MIIDFSEPIGMVRLEITDIDEESPLFEDRHIEAFLSMANGSIPRAAAKALLVMARSEVLISKKIRTQDLSTDGPAVSAELRAHAKELIAGADAEDAAAEGSFFDLIPFGCYTKPEGAEWRL